MGLRWGELGLVLGQAGSCALCLGTCGALVRSWSHCIRASCQLELGPKLRSAPPVGTMQC